MADRYWVGGDGVWSSTNTTKWSTTSGGSGGASVPTSSDTVYFDELSNVSGTLSVTISGSVQCSSFYNLRDNTIPLKINGTSNDSVNIWGAIVSTNSSSNAIDYSSAFCWFVLNTNSTSDSNSVQLIGANPVRYIRVPHAKRARISFTEGSGTISQLLIGELCYVRFVNTSRILSIIQERSSPSSYTTTQLYIGTFSEASTAKLYIDGGGKCLDGTMNITSNSTDSYLVWTGLGGSSTFNLPFGTVKKLVISPSVSGRTFTLDGTASFSGSTTAVATLLREPASPSFTVAFQPTSNYSIGTFSLSGDISTTIYIRSSVDKVRAKITKTGGGLVETDYVDVRDMQPYPDNTWISYNSTNSGNNYQWYFDTFTKPTSCLFFGSPV